MKSNAPIDSVNVKRWCPEGIPNTKLIAEEPPIMHSTMTKRLRIVIAIDVSSKIKYILPKR